VEKNGWERRQLQQGESGQQSQRQNPRDLPEWVATQVHEAEEEEKETSPFEYPLQPSFKGIGGGEDGNQKPQK
jgi:hypothetical protein